MAETIESFVAKLQAEGIEAGQQDAEKLRTQAKAQAEQIVQDAEAHAAKIVVDAELAAAKLLERSKVELDLAARDVILRLPGALVKAMEAVLARSAEKTLCDSDFLAKTLHKLVLLYAKADVEHGQTMEINVCKKLQSELADWAISQIAHKAQEAGMSVDLHGSLPGTGFEYSVTGAKVEVTPAAVVESISEFLGPRLGEVIKAALSEDAKRPKDTGDKSTPCPVNAGH